jgi:hypothetical protein
MPTTIAILVGIGALVGAIASGNLHPTLVYSNVQNS